MKYASAIRFGGELVSPEECDYNSYKHLGLLCPECKDPVFLRAGGERIRGETVYQVGAHFSHFAAKDPALAAQCEKRVNQYGVAELAKRAASARNQRLKLMQRHLWNIFRGYYDRAGFPLDASGFESQIDSLKIALPGRMYPLIDLPTSVFYQHTQKQLAEKINTFVDGLKEGAVIGSELKHPDGHCWFPSPDIQAVFRNQTHGQLDWRLHKLITLEVGQFLLNKRNQELVRSIMQLAIAVIFFAMAEEGVTCGSLPSFSIVSKIVEGKFYVHEQAISKKDAYEGIAVTAIDHLLLWLTCLPWAAEFDRIRQQEEKTA